MARSAGKIGRNRVFDGNIGWAAAVPMRKTSCQDRLHTTCSAP